MGPPFHWPRSACMFLDSRDGQHCPVECPPYPTRACCFLRRTRATFTTRCLPLFHLPQVWPAFVNNGQQAPPQHQVSIERRRFGGPNNQRFPAYQTSTAHQQAGPFIFSRPAAPQHLALQLAGSSTFVARCRGIACEAVFADDHTNESRPQSGPASTATLLGSVLKQLAEARSPSFVTSVFRSSTRYRPNPTYLAAAHRHFETATELYYRVACGTVQLQHAAEAYRTFLLRRLVAYHRRRRRCTWRPNRQPPLDPKFSNPKNPGPVAAARRSRLKSTPILWHLLR